MVVTIRKRQRWSQIVAIEKKQLATDHRVEVVMGVVSSRSLSDHGMGHGDGLMEMGRR